MSAPPDFVMGPRSDVLVIGAGAAGLSVALATAPRTVRVLSLAEPARDGASTWAQGGIAAALGAQDSPALHAADTLAAGQHLNQPEAVARLTAAAAGVIDWLQTLGAHFDRRDDVLLLGREAAHGQARIVHAHGDATGAEVMRALGAASRAMRHIELQPGRRAIALAQDRNGQVTGAWAWNGSTLELWPARAVVLASGGYAALYRYTTNPEASDGSGVALALAAGAQLADLEFVQFHPTALAPRDAAHSGQLPLLTEALRGAGATLIDAYGARFMLAEHALAELAPRDVVARAIAARCLADTQVYLDARVAVGAEFPQRFPTVFAACMQAGIDPRTQPMPVTPAAHYCMGGVRTDAQARSTLEGLYAVGEAAASGVHGANRLASNSLLEGLAFGRELGLGLAAVLPQPGATALPCPRHFAPLPAPLRVALADMLWAQAGLVRSEYGLALAAAQIGHWLEPMDATASGADLLRFAAAAVAAMRARRHSIGAHWRSDAQQAA
jgi:L-aspartate oxidase